MSIITPESKVDVLQLPEHSRRCLQKAGVLYVDDLLSRAGAELRAYCDVKAMNEIKAALSGAGLHLGDDLEEEQP